MDGAVVDRVGKIADVLDGGVLGLGQRASVLLNLNREMDDAVVGETEEEDGPAPCADTLQDSRSGHLWTPPTPAPPGARGSLSWRTRRGGPSSSPFTPPARELRGASPCCWISWVGGVRRDGRRPGGGPLPSPGRFELKGLDWSEPGD